MSLAAKVSEYVKDRRVKAKIAVMGCVVNGPGEARDCDLGIAGGNGSSMLFEKGEPFLRGEADMAEETFFFYLDKLLKEREEGK